jgi:hypothetical protein
VVVAVAVVCLLIRLGFYNKPQQNLCRCITLHSRAYNNALLRDEQLKQKFHATEEKKNLVGVSNSTLVFLSLNQSSSVNWLDVVVWFG